jgi:lipoyl(octanoyl) transferase
VTFHGPGQLVGYPILGLAGECRDAHRYLRDLEQALIRAVGRYGIAAVRDPGLTGVWVEERKLAAIGVRLSTGWITSHGFALNVRTDLRGFDCIVPCGIADRGVTSLAELLDDPPPLLDVARAVADELAAVLGRRLELEGAAA